MADKEYIEREALLEILNGLYDHHLMMCNYAADGATQDCIEAVTEAPTADVVEVRHGEWIDWHMVKIDRRAKEYPSVRCTNCGIIFCDLINDHNYMYRYCPHCGAKMNGGNENG